MGKPNKPGRKKRRGIKPARPVQPPRSARTPSAAKHVSRIDQATRDEMLDDVFDRIAAVNPNAHPWQEKVFLLARGLGEAITIARAGNGSEVEIERAYMTGSTMGRDAARQYLAYDSELGGKR